LNTDGTIEQYMKKLIIAVLIMIPSFNLAQTTEFYRNEAQLTSGFNTQSAFEIEIAYSFLFNQYAGITLGLDMMDQSFRRLFCNSNREDMSLFRSLVCGSCDEDDLWLNSEQYKREYGSALLVRPAVRLRLPLFKESGEDVLVFNMETGLFFSLIPNETLTYQDGKRGYYGEKSIKNKDGRWLYHHLKGYVSMDLDRVQLSAGYSFSDFDIFDSRRTIIFDKTGMRETVRNRKKTSAVFLVLAWRF
jgi:hypothetical protein